MLRCILFFLIGFVFLSAKSQALLQDSTILSITIFDEKQLPAQGATLQLFRGKDSALVKTAVAGANGTASFYNVPPGSYAMQVSSTGYQTQYTQAFQFPNGKVPATICLQPLANNLKEVSVTSTKPLIQHLQGKTIVNVDAAVTNVGTTVLEVLEKSPGVTVDKNGTLALQGRTGVLVMIDDKQTYLSGTELSNLLASMSSAQVEQIELITNPSAKYDAAGNAGIINIKTKKSKQVGFNGTASVAAGIGYYPRNNNSLLVNYRNGKFNTFFNYSMNLNKTWSRLYALRSYFDPSTRALTQLLEQPTIFTNQSFNNTIKTGMDYYASKKTTIGISLTGVSVSRNGSSDASAAWKNPSGAVDSAIGTSSTSASGFTNGAINLNAKHTINKTQEISMDIDWLGYKITNQQYFSNQFLATGGYNQASQGDLPATIRIFSAKADHSFHFGKEGKLESGLKSSHITTDNIAAYQFFDGSQWKEDFGKSNHFLYTENIMALYSSVEQKQKRFAAQLGLRYEYTHYNAHQLGNALNKDSSFSRKYDGFFPSGYVSYEADSSHSFTLTVGRRIDRPAFQKLNPFVFIINKYTYQKGNPFFLPQYTWNIELSHQYKQLLTTAVSYSIIENYFSQLFLDNGNDILVYTEGNVGKMYNLGVSMTVQAPLFKWWSVTGQAVFNNKKFNGFVWGKYNSSVGQLNVNLNNQFRITPKLTAELSGFYTTTSRNDLQELLSPTGQVSAGAAMLVLKKKGTLKLSVRDMFFSQLMEGVTDFKSASEYFTFRRDSRVVNLSFSFRFGKPLKATKRSNGGARDEIERVGAGG